jgi:hypothetical protein
MPRLDKDKRVPHNEIDHPIGRFAVPVAPLKLQKDLPKVKTPQGQGQSRHRRRPEYKPKELP